MKGQRSDEEQVYDVHAFIGRYITVLKAQKIPFKKEQIGVLEQILLAENPAPVKSLQEDPRERLLNRIVPVKDIKYYSTTINAIERVDVEYELPHKKYGTYTNIDFLNFYNYCIRANDTQNMGFIFIRGFSPTKLYLLGEYLRQKGLLPAEREQKTGEST